MKFKNFISFILTITFIFLLMCYENQFQNVHNALILESNDLFSPHCLLADKSINLVWKSLQNSRDKFCVYGLLEKNTKYTAMAYYSTNYKQFRPPLYSGLFFYKPNSHEAIVGEKIETTIVNGIEYFNYHDKYYKVIGKLGISSDSPLKKHVLINDTDLLNKQNIQLVFDGNNIKNISWLKGESFEAKGVERWFNLTFISKWIYWTVMIVILCASALAAYFYEMATSEVNIMRYQIGINAKKILMKGLVILTVTTLFIAIIIWLLNYFNIVSFTLIKAIISCLLFYLTMVITYSILATKRITKGKCYE